MSEQILYSDIKLKRLVRHMMVAYRKNADQIEHNLSRVERSKEFHKQNQEYENKFDDFLKKDVEVPDIKNRPLSEDRVKELERRLNIDNVPIKRIEEDREQELMDKIEGKQVLKATLQIAKREVHEDRQKELHEKIEKKLTNPEIIEIKEKISELEEMFNQLKKDKKQNKSKLKKIETIIKRLKEKIN